MMPRVYIYMYFYAVSREKYGNIPGVGKGYNCKNITVSIYTAVYLCGRHR